MVDPLVASDQEGDGEGDGDQGAEHKGGERHQPELGAGQLNQAVIQPVQVHQRDENCQPWNKKGCFLKLLYFLIFLNIWVLSLTLITWKPEKKKVEDAKENLVFFEQIIDVDERTNKVEGSKKDTEDDMSQGGHT